MSWLLLYVAGAGTLPEFPQVGEHVVVKLGQDPDTLTKDKENTLWDKIQDGNRPAWAPDLYRLGYAVVFKGDDAEALMKKLNVVAPEDASTASPLTWDNVWVCQVEPWMRPFPCPPTKLSTEEWWDATGWEEPKPGSAYLAPRGVTVMVGAQRLIDLIAMREMTPQGYRFRRPPPFPLGDAPDNPMAPILPVIYRDPLEDSGAQRYGGYGAGIGTQGIPLFRGY